MDDVADPPSANRPDADIMDISPSLHGPAADQAETDISDRHTSHPPGDPVDRPIPSLPDAAPCPPPATTAPQPVPNPATAPPSVTSGTAMQPPPASVEAGDNRETEFVYVLQKYDAIPEVKVYSPWHLFGGFRWRLLIFPKGNQSSSHDLSVYLECGGPVVRPSAPDLHSAAAHNAHPPVSASHAGKEAAVATMPPLTWSRPAKFSLHLVNPASPLARLALARVRGEAEGEDGVEDRGGEGGGAVIGGVEGVGGVGVGGGMQDMSKETSHTFRENASDWGFLEFASFATLQPMQYADEDMNVVIMVRIRLQDNLSDTMFNSGVNWDSRKETGFVGFKNQGATCYMNSLLQTLYMVSEFRKAVYEMPLPEAGNELTGSELSYALQKVFFELQFSPTVVKTKKLTESFGWDTTDAFTQHDVQELKLILCDELAEKMKKIAPNRPNTMSQLFQGKIMNYIECVNVDYKSSREEEFSDLSLNVKGCKNVYESFDKYTEVEMMEGDNKYRADGFAELQDARKGVKFLKLPPVLQLHLKRFEYDFSRYAMVKINDRYEFEPELDLCRYVENSDGTDIYVLHSVLVHIGDVNGGHYHAFIRPEIDVSDAEPKKPSPWFKFDDENVSSATEEAAIQDNFGVGGERDLPGKRGTGMDDDLGNGGVNGGQTPPPSVFQPRNRNYQTRRFSNAYMLQYLRKLEVPHLLKRPEDNDVPEQLADRIRKEREEEEQRKRDRAEQHLYMNIAVAIDDDMAEHHGTDLVQWDKVRQLRVKRALQLGELKQRLQKEGLVQDARRMRLWKCSNRQNETIRPDTLVARGIDSQPITDPNSRDPLTQTGYNVALYSGRHGYYGHDDSVRMYAEDFCSPFCLLPGEAFTKYAEEAGEWAEKEDESSVLQEHHLNVADMDTDSLRNSREASSAGFPLAPDREVLLFLKHYTPSPEPRLQWLGHFVVDRSAKVRELHPLLRKSLTMYCRRDSSQRDIRTDTAITVYEEVSAMNIGTLRDDRTLVEQKIPYESGSGDILVFQESILARKKMTNLELDLRALSPGEDDGWDGMQEPSRGDGDDLPLGGRPLPVVKNYFDYLNFRIKIEFKDKHAVGGPDEGRSIFLEMLRSDRYSTARRVLAGVLGDDTDPNYMRFYNHDYNRDTAAQEPLRLRDSDELERVLPASTMMNTGQPDYRILWYERTEYPLSEFDQNDEVRVVWRQDGGARATPLMNTNSGNHDSNGMNIAADNIIRADVAVSVGADDHDTRSTNGSDTMNGQVLPSYHRQGNGNDVAKTFSVLVPVLSRYQDVMDQVRLKLGISSDVGIRMLEIKSSKIFRFINASDAVPPLMTAPHDCGAELRAEPIPEDETDGALGAEYDLMSVVHLAKDKKPRVWRGLTFFGDPFVIKVRRDGESIRIIRKRILNKMGCPEEEFEQWPLAEIVQLKVIYLNELDTIYKPQSQHSTEFRSLAIEHKSTAPTKKTASAMSRYADKPLKIRS